METNKILIAAIAILAVLQVITFIVVSNSNGVINCKNCEGLGAATHFSGPIDSEEGFSVDDTTVIDGDGNISSKSGIIGSVLSTSTGATGTSTAANICAGYSQWSVTPLVEGGTTLYFPASTTIAAAGCLDTVGEKIMFDIYIATSSIDAVGGYVTFADPTIAGYGGSGVKVGTSTDPVVLYEGQTAHVIGSKPSTATTTFMFYMGGY